MNILYTLISVVIVSAISLLGVLSFGIKEDKLKQIVSFLVALSVGTLIGDVFLHILPESVEQLSKNQIAFGVIGGILLFYTLENILSWRHCHVHTDDTHKHELAISNIVGDALHNFIDGLIIASSFSVSIEVGIATTIAVILHEIPQEIGDYGVLIYSGLSRKKALLFNLISGLFAVLGVVLFYTLGDLIESFSDIVLMIAAGGFLYIAIADLIPELKHNCNKTRSILNILFMISGVLIMFILTLLN